MWSIGPWPYPTYKYTYFKIVIALQKVALNFEELFKLKHVCKGAYELITCIGDYPDRCGVLVGSSSQERACSLGACPKYNPWAEWSECSVSCGPGFQVYELLKKHSALLRNNLIA